MDPKRSAPSLLSSLVIRTYSQSPRSAKKKNITLNDSFGFGSTEKFCATLVLRKITDFPRPHPPSPQSPVAAPQPPNLPNPRDVLPLCDRMSSVSVSKNKAKTFVCASLNILVNISVTRLNSVALSKRASRKYICNPMRPSFRSAQWVLAQFAMISPMS